ncbi:hypothetical protein HK101_001714 [Irineochytrium annulatum]|nr:hypothetical protein HK101_001714 [Irineochytrium annulatum]
MAPSRLLVAAGIVLVRAADAQVVSLISFPRDISLTGPQDSAVITLNVDNYTAAEILGSGQRETVTSVRIDLGQNVTFVPVSTSLVNHAIREQDHLRACVPINPANRTFELTSTSSSVGTTVYFPEPGVYYWYADKIPSRGSVVPGQACKGGYEGTIYVDEVPVPPPTLNAPTATATHGAGGTDGPLSAAIPFAATAGALVGITVLLSIAALVSRCLRGNKARGEEDYVDMEPSRRWRSPPVPAFPRAPGLAMERHGDVAPTAQGPRYPPAKRRAPPSSAVAVDRMVPTELNWIELVPLATDGGMHERVTWPAPSRVAAGLSIDRAPAHGQGRSHNELQPMLWVVAPSQPEHTAAEPTPPTEDDVETMVAVSVEPAVTEFALAEPRPTSPALHGLVAVPDVASWSTDDVARWLEEDLQLESSVAAAFRENYIDGGWLAALSDDDLIRLGVSDMNTRVTFREALRLSRASEGDVAPPPYQSPA